MHLPGLRVVTASSPGSAYSLLRAAIDDPNPTLFYEHKGLYARKGPVVRGEIAEIGKAQVIRPGSDVTIVTTRLMVERGAWAVPTLVTFQALKEEGADLGLPAVSVAKIDEVRLAGLQSLDIMRTAGVTMAYGTDLLGAMHRRQSEEFLIRSQVLPAREIIASATGVAAKVLGMADKLGVVAPNAFADLIVVEGNPLADIAVLTGQGERIPAIMKGGSWVKNELN